MLRMSSHWGLPIGMEATRASCGHSAYYFVALNEVALRCAIYIRFFTFTNHNFINRTYHAYTLTN